MKYCHNQQFMDDGGMPYVANIQQMTLQNDAIFIPAGTWHNIVNSGTCPLKVSVFYAPPHHPSGTVNCTKADAER